MPCQNNSRKLSWDVINCFYRRVSYFHVKGAPLKAREPPQQSTKANFVCECTFFCVLFQRASTLANLSRPVVMEFWCSRINFIWPTKVLKIFHLLWNMKEACCVNIFVHARHSWVQIRQRQYSKWLFFSPNFVTMHFMFNKSKVFLHNTPNSVFFFLIFFFFFFFFFW